MKSVFGKNIIISLFGESHEEYMGVTIHGLKAGIELNVSYIKSELTRRRPNNSYETNRVEPDEFKIISGYLNNKTTGAPLTVIVKNVNYNSNYYVNGDIRPGHADYPSYVRFHGANDYNGGGHFSGRITTLIVIAGAIIKQVLAKSNIEITSYVTSVGGKTNQDDINKLLDSLRKDGNTCGFSIEAKVKNMPVGVGEPFFDSVESILSHLLFSIPSVKGVSFGDSDIHNKLGSEVIDTLNYENKEVVIKNNHNGGINGGLTNGNDIICNVMFKPIPTINKVIETINVKEEKNIEKAFNGSHDACICNRCGVIVEAMIAIGIIDLLASFYGSEWM